MPTAKQIALIISIFGSIALSACGWVDDGIEKNEPPIPADDNYTLAEGGTLDVDASSGVLANDTDAGGATLTARLVSGPAYAQSFQLNSDGSFQYIHDAGEATSDRFTYIANDGIKDSIVKVVAITLEPINDPPVILSQTENPVAIPENTPVDVMPHLLVSDPDNTYPNDFTVTVLPGSNYTVAGSMVTPVLNYTGSLSVSLTVNDGHDTSDVFTMTLMVMSVNDPPVFLSIPVTSIGTNDLYVYQVVAADPDANDNLTISAPTLPAWLSLIPTGNGTATLVGRPRFSDLGDHPVYLLVADNGSPVRYAIQSFVINVFFRLGSDNDENDDAFTQQVVEQSDCWTLSQEQSLNTTLLSEPTLVAPVTYSLLTEPSNGKVELDVTGHFIYTPTRNGKRGSDTFTYGVTDSSGRFISRTATVIVNSKLLALGDSVTVGVIDATDPLVPTTGTAQNGGFRQPLLSALNKMGFDVDFVGNQSNGVGADDGTVGIGHEGHEGWSASELALGSPTQDPQYPESGVYHWLTESPADIVLVHVGTDIPTTNIDGIRAILDAINRWEHDTGNIVTVILARIIDNRTPNPDVSVYNDKLSSLASERMAAGDHIVLIDQQSALWDLSGLPDPNLYADARHPNTDGYAKMADVWLQALNGVLIKCPN